ncbi:MAG: hypothetical protein HRU36_05590 [Rickettsiales bacterium]|nr:hypothetical protein [Rickettsiales bacterium]
MSKSYGQMLREAREYIIEYSTQHLLNRTKTLSRINAGNCTHDEYDGAFLTYAIQNMQPNKFCIYSQSIESKTVDLCEEPCDEERDLKIENNKIVAITYPGSSGPTSLPNECLQDPIEQSLMCKCVTPSITCNGEITVNDTVIYLPGELGSINSTCSCD